MGYKTCIKILNEIVEDNLIKDKELKEIIVKEIKHFEEIRK